MASIASSGGWWFVGKATTSHQQKKAPGRKSGAKKPKALFPTIADQVIIDLICHLPRCHSEKNFYGTMGLVSLRDMESAAEGLPPYQRQFNIYLYTWELRILA
ncbi:uncharacterized protein P174DRAFT_439093 [Aspergillus novofumigatus IBT 16806]|uniref:Uncharacterized protein n=1 Tax=Aspergillus novofumigatus (strain IBT 16806) TaxID=1392255 RepID=A0A2I1CI81_ASPN1|nr:uncharacterized protein P174DRAFT_439093 [Aspergillus novofumigatus IBT 16806]PKX97307.1 hypothetical protein P174DRAFT_439093 [Aspergillus novofumigatus IBT 16806]